MGNADHTQLLALGFPEPLAKNIAAEYNLDHPISRQTLESLQLAKLTLDSGGAKTVTMLSKDLAEVAVAAGADPDEAAIMLAGDVDPEMLQLWLDQQAPKTSRTLGNDPDLSARVKIMAQPDVDPELRGIFLAQAAAGEPAPPSGPLGMDADRYQLHQEAKQLSAARCLADPRLDPGKAYALAAVEIDARRDPGVI